MGTDLTALNAGAKLPATHPEGPGPKDGKPTLQQAAQSFESFFIYLLLSEMRKTTESSQFGQGLGQGIYQSLFDQGLADAMTKKGGLGLADALIRNYK